MQIINQYSFLIVAASAVAGAGFVVWRLQHLPRANRIALIGMIAAGALLVLFSRRYTPADADVSGPEVVRASGDAVLVMLYSDY
ncbi:MAG: hypothetical protein IT326_00500 [Anaerolineae bacterium]|nr:hypothetical protein [Anaerolineae bacterium]